ncbi:MFS transporter [Mucilaginibacter gossypii]|uniref:Lysosomal dipeptide transporter MFSD1 n=1 Tax=Mucilaginibacter gossypii TaxID=551996 RepID=A0A1G8CZ47_9SPHI|nr:MFS transporter [Mucilaginibacter gossypii]SDH50761.1 Sugar phosphate permease [Mucilaginibacter gossypii]
MKNITSPAANPTMSRMFRDRAFIIAWVFGLIFYFLEYVIRSAPAVMISQLSTLFKVNALGVSGILGTYYYTYSVTSLIAGMSLDRFGARYPIAIGTGILFLGCLAFAAPSAAMGDFGRLLQGAGSAFAFTGCVYLAAHGFAPCYLATAIGVTQCIGMLGGSAGQFVTGPLLRSGLPVTVFWVGIGIACGIVTLMLFLSTPAENKRNQQQNTLSGILVPYRVVFSNPQSYLSGLISGLLFAPTTIFAMTWGVTFLQHDRGFSYSLAVITCSMVPLGWVIGAPLLGWFSDLLGRRKPVLSLCIILMVICLIQFTYFPGLISAFVTMLIFGIASGTAMIPYSIIKEANPDSVKGSATGGINFLTFGVTAILGPVFAHFFGKTLTTAADPAVHFNGAVTFLLATTGMAFLISLIIKETGSAAKK